LEFDDLDDEEKDSIYYTSLSSSFIYMWDTCLGEIMTDTFDLGLGSQKPYLFLLNIFAQFILLIHMLNMLIAIMGNTFSQRNEVADQIKMKDHLGFVIDNWYLMSYALGDTKQIKYIITAFHANEEEDDNEMLQNIEESQSALKDLVVTNYEEIQKRTK
jgi:hypothetical protein